MKLFSQSLLIFTGSLFMLCSDYGFSQEYRFTQNYINELDQYIEYSNINRTNAPTVASYENIQGSPFLNKEFKNGQIRLKDGKIFQGPLRYDMYADQIEFKTTRGEIFSLVNPENVEYIALDDISMVYVMENSDRQKGSFYQELVSGNYDLLVKHSVILKDPVAARPYVEAKPAMFIPRNKQFFIYNEKRGLFEIKNNKSLPDIVPEQADAVNGFVKREKVKISEEESLVKLAEFLNTLMP